MNAIKTIRKLEETLEKEADSQIDPEAKEHMYDLLNYIGDWEAVWTNRNYDNQIEPIE
jgi:ribonucleotide reductase beta subunit family protein with ferritin-like domain